VSAHRHRCSTKPTLRLRAAACSHQHLAPLRPDSRHPQPAPRRDDALRTEGIYSDSYQLVQAARAVRRGSAQLSGGEGRELAAVEAVRRALDAGEAVPDDAGPHDVAATLLSYFKSLPQPFIPAQISQVRTRGSGSGVRV